jgi:hypothetical protein
VLQAIVIGMQGAVSGFRRSHFVLSAGDFVLAAGHLGYRALQLSLKFRDLQNSKRLPFVDPIANVHVDGSDKTGNFGMNVDDLVGLELPCKRQDVRDRTPLHDRNPCGGWLWSGFDFSAPVRTQDKPCGQS